MPSSPAPDQQDLQPLRVVIVDDDKSCRELTPLLIQAGGYAIVGQAETVAAATKRLPTLKPDVLFLEVELPDGNGIDLANITRPWYRGLVYMTSSAVHAPNAFDLGAIDYLIKPVEKSRFDLMLNRIRRHFSVRKTSAVKKSPAEPLARFLVRHQGEWIVVKAHTVDWFESDGDCVKIHVGDRLLVENQSLAGLEQVLDGRIFVRVHRRAIVNLDRIRTMRFGREGDGFVVLSTGAEVPVSRTYRASLMANY